MIAKASLILLTATTLFAAGPGGPISGWTLDNRTATIRAITGIPGALRLADPLPLPSGIAAAEFSPSGDLAAAITTDQPAHFIIVSGMKSSATVIDLGEVPSDARILALNSKGTAAVLYSASQHSLRFGSALETTPALSDPVATDALAGPVTAGVLEASGTCAVLGTGSVETLCLDGSTRRVIPTAGLAVSTLTLANSDRDLWIADTTGQQILRVPSYAQQSGFTVFASPTDGVLQPIALAVSPAGLILVADAAAQAVFVIDPTGAPVQAVSLNFVPSQLRPLTDRTLLLLNDLNSLPFTLFTSEGMRTYFVPAN